MTDEEWRPVVGYEGYYEVSDLGRVRSVDRVSNIGRRLKGKAMKQTAGSHGYLSVSLSREGVVKVRTVHSLVLEAFVGARPEGMEGCHGPNGVGDNRLSQLRWDSRRENALDRVRHGTHSMVNRAKCPRGHPLEGANLVPSKWARGFRECLACNYARSRVFRGDLSVEMKELADQYHSKIMDTNPAATAA